MPLSTQRRAGPVGIDSATARSNTSDSLANASMLGVLAIVFALYAPT